VILACVVSDGRPSIGEADEDRAKNGNIGLHIV
jgi:hypothetical protein